MSDIKAKLLLYFIGDIDKVKFTGYKVLKQSYSFKTTEIKFNKSLFGYTKEKIIIDFELILNKKKKNGSEFLSFKLCIYSGENKAYCYIDSINTDSYDICCLYKDLKIEQNDFVFSEINYRENDPRCRLVVINAPSTFDVNGGINKKNLYEPEEINDYNSFQLAVYDSLFNIYLVKQIEEEDFSEEISILNYLKEKKDILKMFFKEFSDLVNNKEKDRIKYKHLLNKMKIETQEVSLAKRKDILEKEFDNEEKYYLLYLYFIWYLCFLYFHDEENKFDIRVDIMMEFIKKFYETYNKDKNLLTYQKAELFCSNCVFFFNFDNIQEYLDSELNYVILKNVDKESVFGYSINFLNEFIDSLNSNSYLFYPLLLLNCGVYYYRDKKPCYGFDFQEFEKIKGHLRELIPDVIFTYKKKDLIDEEKGFNFKGLRTVFLNNHIILDKYKGDPKKKDSDCKTVKHYAMRTSKCLMHECFGHNKFNYQRKRNIDTPIYFFNKENKFITMRPKEMEYLKDDEQNIFDVNRKKEGSESGYFLEYFFGFYDDELILDLLYNIPYIGKLYDNVKSFADSSLDILKNYIIYKYKLSCNGINYNDQEKTSLKEDIKEMEILLEDEQKKSFFGNKIKGKEINKDAKKDEIKKDDNSTNDIKKDDNKKIFFVEEKEIEEENYSYYLRKIKEAKTMKERGDWEWEFLRNLKQT